MLSRLPISLAQLKAGNNSEKLKNEMKQLLYSLYRSKKINQNNLKTFDQYYLKMERIFINTENSKTSQNFTEHSNEPPRFRSTLANKLNLKDRNKNMALANLSIHYTWKNIKSAYNNNDVKISAPT